MVASSRHGTEILKTPGTWLSGVLLCVAAVTAQAACPAPSETESAVVESVIDGDTLRLADGRSLRLIGINAPELGHDGAPDQPLAQRARRAVRERLPENGYIYLRIGEAGHDRYGRLLASVFLTRDGDHLGEYLLAQGLGWQVVVPPDTRYLECLRAAERRAREMARGVWDIDRYRVRPVTSLKPEEGGFMRVRGVVSRVADSRRARWLELGSNLSLRVARDHLAYFDEVPDADWEGRQLIVRGWVVHRGNNSRGHPPHMMHLYHPAMIEASESAGAP